VSSLQQTEFDEALRNNDDIANDLDEIAELLQAQGANPFRVRAYHMAADTLRELHEPVYEIIGREGLPGLVRLPTIGKSLAHTIDQLAHTGRLPLLERLRGEDVPEQMFATLGGVGSRLARRIHEKLGIETLSELQAAVYDGRLATVPGMGDKRVRAIRESLAGRFRQPLQSEPPRKAESRPKTESPPPATLSNDPPVAVLLEIDGEYRRMAEHGRLPRIAPRRFNPTAAAWLPILHTERGHHHYTALYSNTARAHELGATHDWVVIYRDDDDGHGQWTVITSNFGKLRGQRIVRGREAECAAYYEQQLHRPRQMQLI
jgi:hypothetical protein